MLKKGEGAKLSARTMMVWISLMTRIHLSAFGHGHVWLQGAGHNDVELYSQYLDRLKQFVSVELAN